MYLDFFCVCITHTTHWGDRHTGNGSEGYIKVFFSLHLFFSSSGAFLQTSYAEYGMLCVCSMHITTNTRWSIYLPAIHACVPVCVTCCCSLLFFLFLHRSLSLAGWHNLIVSGIFIKATHCIDGRSHVLKIHKYMNENVCEKYNAKEPNDHFSSFYNCSISMDQDDCLEYLRIRLGYRHLADPLHIWAMSIFCCPIFVYHYNIVLMRC